MFSFLKRKKNSQSFEETPENSNLKKESFSSNYDQLEDCRMKEVVYFSTDKDCYIKTYIPERIQNPIGNDHNSLNSYRNSCTKDKDTTKEDKDIDILNDILDLYFEMANEKTQSVYSQINYW